MGWPRLELGVGVIALGSLDQLWSGVKDLVDVVEVEPQTLWRAGSAADGSCHPNRWPGFEPAAGRYCRTASASR